MTNKNTSGLREILSDFSTDIVLCSSLANVLREELMDGGNVKEADLCNVTTLLTQILTKAKITIGDIQISLFGFDE